MIIIFLSTIIFLQNNVKNTINSSDESLVLYSDTENITIDNSLPISDKLFNKEYILKLLEDHKNNKKDNYRRIWAVYSFLKWYEVFFINEKTV